MRNKFNNLYLSILLVIQDFLYHEVHYSCIFLKKMLGRAAQVDGLRYTRTQ
jgi:hypothetical protein